MRLFKRVPKGFSQSPERSKGDHSQALRLDAEPIFLEEPLSLDKKATQHHDKPKKSAMLWCMPYFYLGKYGGHRPMQTLLQARFAGTTEDRDKQQASCKVLNATNPLCFHVAQMWALAINQCMLDSFVSVCC